MKSCACAARAAASISSRRRVEPAVAQVVGDRAGEQHRILEHDGDALAQRSDAVLAHVDAVDQHASGRRVVEARNQADQRRLAGAREADERDHLARPGLEGDVVQHVRAVGIREADVLEADVARRRSTRRPRRARRRSPAASRTSPARASRRPARPGAVRSCARSPRAVRRRRRDTR